jgi:uncharacterized protein YgbK (DUF1537 family)
LIIVIADDFTGAAELGGVAFRYGLTAKVQSEFNARADVDLISIDADTRSCTAQEAARRVAGVAELCREEAVERVFKKVDSVLRGQVIAELTALLGTWGKRRALLVPANPGLGRVIAGGHYFIDGRPLHETDFARDPEYPATTSNVLAILGPAGPWPVHVLPPGEIMPDRGVLVGEAKSNADLAAWASRLDDDTLPAGAAQFFAAFLSTAGFKLAKEAAAEIEETESVVEPVTESAIALFVCGSTSSYTRSFCKTCEAHGIPVLRMSADLFERSRAWAASSKDGSHAQSARLIREWADTTVKALKAHRRAVVAIDQPLCRDPGLPQILSHHLGEVVEQVINSHPVDRLFAEGGATAVALVQRFGWKRLRVCKELMPGVVSMLVEGTPGPLLTMKPGSYAWPDEILGLP